jgi:hypothetical protein
MGEGEFDILGIYTLSNSTVTQRHEALCYVLLVWLYVTVLCITCVFVCLFRHFSHSLYVRLYVIKLIWNTFI